MINVAALTSGRCTPSARLRIRQHIGPLKRSGICVREYLPVINKYSPIPEVFSSFNLNRLVLFQVLWKLVKIAAVVPGVAGTWKAGVNWLERGILPGLLTFEPFLKRPCVLDVDDAIWMTPPFGSFALRHIARNIDVVIAGNTYIADWFSPYAKDIRIVPTAVDTDYIRPSGHLKTERSKRPYRVGWIGTSGNYLSLYTIEKALDRFISNYDAELLIVSDQPPRFSMLKSEKLKYIRWTPSAEMQALGLIDVGIMPLISNEWSLGKCSFKMLQYMAAGLPVIVSPIGMNAEVLSMGEVGYGPVNEADWYDSLVHLYSNSLLSLEYGRRGRLIVERHFSRSIISSMLADIFNEFR